MTDINPFLPPALRQIAWREHPLDGKLLLFDRDTGLNVLAEGEEVQGLRRAAPRTLLIAVTNHCNLACPFCYRDLKSASRWRYFDLLDFCREAADWGVLEVAFGGGEPTVFPRWADFICELYDSTDLCLNFTTNGVLLSDEMLAAIAGKYGQIRLSLYEDNHWPDTVQRLAAHEARFGVNWLLTPAELAGFEAKFARLYALGVRDYLLLSYKGSDPALHFGAAHYTRLQRLVEWARAVTDDQAEFKLDVCWGDMLPGVPRLFTYADCGAGDDFLSITSDKQIKPCSFHHTGIPFDTLADVRAYWEQTRLSQFAAQIGGCGRLPGRGLKVRGGLNHATIHLAAVQRQP